MKRYTCNICGWRFFDKEEAQQHTKKKHGYCKLCGLRVQDSGEFLEHIDKEHVIGNLNDDSYLLGNIDPEYFRPEKV